MIASGTPVPVVERQQPELARQPAAKLATKLRMTLIWVILPTPPRSTSKWPALSSSGTQVYLGWMTCPLPWARTRVHGGDDLGVGQAERVDVRSGQVQP